MIPFVDLAAQYAAMGVAIDERIARVIRRGQFIMGPEVAECEAALAEFTGAAHCVTAASGTEALLIALMALGVGPGDEVITSAFSFAASAEVIALAGAVPRFIDIEPAQRSLRWPGLSRGSSTSSRTPPTSTPSRSKRGSARTPAPSSRSAFTGSPRTWSGSMPSPAATH